MSTLGCVPSMIATHEFVVPRSMPMILPVDWDMWGRSFFLAGCAEAR
jgi:hypothetical protein